jgi:DASH complex subunit DAD1
MSSTNVLNRKLEEVFGVGREFETVAGLWGVSDPPAAG